MIIQNTVIFEETPCKCQFPDPGGIKTMNLIVALMLLSSGCVQSQFFEDRRCRCVCPSPASVLNTTNTRQIYTGNVPPSQCHCEGVVFPVLKEELEGKVHIFCPRCECVYQTRNTTLIMTTVFLILSAITMAVLYLMSFTWLKFLTGRTYVRRDDRRHTRSDDRDYVREYRGAYERERELERQRVRRLLDSSSESDDAVMLLEDH